MNKMKILCFLTFLLVFTSFGLSAPAISGTITPQTKAEDSLPWTLDLSAFESGNAGETDAQLTWSVSGVDTTLFTITVEPTTDIATFTPVANAFGSDTVTFTLSNGIVTNDVAQDVLITLTAVAGDAPTITAIDNLDAQEDVAWTYEIVAVDPDKGTLTYSLTTFPIGMAISSTGLISWTPTSAGEETVTVKVVDSDTLSDNKTFKVLVGPNLCDGSETGQIDITKFKIEDGSDDFYPGDAVIVEIDIDNDYSSSDEDGDVSDIIVELFLYDMEDGDELDNVESETYNLDAGDNENGIELEMELPSDVDDSHEIRVYVLVYEDGNKDVNCRFDNDEIDVKRRTHDVDISKFTVSPSVADPGDSVTVNIEVENVGSRKEKDVTVNIKNSALGLDLISNEFELDKYGKSDADHKITFTFVVPNDINAGTYTIEIDVYDDSNDVYDSGSEFKDLVVSTSGAVNNGNGNGGISVITSLAILSFEAEISEGQSVSIPIKVTNDGNSITAYTIEVVNIDDWADPVSAKTLSVGAGQSVTDYLFLKAKEGVSGKHTATVNVKSGNNVVATQTALVEVVEEGTSFFGGAGNLFGNKTFLWIAGDIVLILLAVLFIKMLFTRKK